MFYYFKLLAKVVLFPYIPYIDLAGFKKKKSLKSRGGDGLYVITDFFLRTLASYINLVTIKDIASCRVTIRHFDERAQSSLLACVDMQVI